LSLLVCQEFYDSTGEAFASFILLARRTQCQCVLAVVEFGFEHIRPWNVQTAAPLRELVERFSRLCVHAILDDADVGTGDYADADGRAGKGQFQGGVRLVGCEHGDTTKAWACTTAAGVRTRRYRADG